MKNITTLILILTITFCAFNALAVTVDQLNDSPLDETQKGPIAQLLLDQEPAKADVVFEAALANIESNKLQSMVKAAADKVAAELVIEQEKTWKKLVAKIKGDKKYEDVWPIAQAHVDSFAHEAFNSDKLAKRYHFEGNFETIVAVQAAHEQRATDRKIAAKLEAKIKQIADRGDKAEAKQRIATGKATMQIMAMFIAELDSVKSRVGKVEDRVTTLETSQLDANKLQADLWEIVAKRAKLKGEDQDNLRNEINTKAVELQEIGTK